MFIGAYFFWTCWLLIVLILFFNFFGQSRFLVLNWLCLLMISFTVNISLADYNVSLCYIILMIGAIHLYTYIPLTIKHIAITFTILIFYMTIRLIEMIAPIWFFMPAILMIPMMMVAILSILVKGYYERLIHIVFAMTIGELFYSFLLFSYHLQNDIVSLFFFDRLFMTILIITFIHLVRTIVRQLVTSFIKT